MKPYYAREGVTIYHGDALSTLDALELGRVDAVITDPPYASGGRTEAEKPRMAGMIRSPKWAKPIENDAMTTTGFVWLIREVALLLTPQLADGGAFFSFIDWRQWPTLVGVLESVNLRVNAMVVWDKTAFGMGYYFRRQHELICAASKGKPRVETHAIGDVIACKRDPNSDHPSPKPVRLMGKLLSVATTPNDRVVDPFMGCGSTLVAAQALKRRAVGIEIVERYCEVAAKRVDALIDQRGP